MTFRVTVLGSSSAMPTLKRNPSAHALNVHEQFFLIDCGEGTQTRLFRCGISPLRLGTVFLTHLHGDHVYGLFGLMSTARPARPAHAAENFRAASVRPDSGLAPELFRLEAAL